MNKGNRQSALESFAEAVEEFNDSLERARRAGLISREQMERVWQSTEELLDNAVETAE